MLVSKTFSASRSSIIERTTNTKQWCILLKSRLWFLKHLQRMPRWATPIRECQQINANLLNIYVPPRRYWPRNIFPLFHSAACQYWIESEWTIRMFATVVRVYASKSGPIHTYETFASMFFSLVIRCSVPIETLRWPIQSKSLGRSFLKSQSRPFYSWGF